LFPLISPTTENKTNKDTESDSKLRRELREKSKMLEEKLKLLRVKEVEFRRVTLSKDKAAKEVRGHMDESLQY
jgi:hypothetical protein